MNKSNSFAEIQTPTQKNDPQTNFEAVGDFDIERTSMAAGGEKAIQGCSIAMLVLLSLPKLAAQMAWAAQWAALGPYLSNLLPSYAVQITQYIGPITGIIVAPTVGALSDICTSKYGRRRPFLLFGAITSCICWILMGYTKDIGEALGDHGSDRFYTGLFTIIFYAWMDITVNIAATPASLLIADFAGDRQTTGAAIGQAASTLGALFVAGYIEIFGPASNSLKTFLWMLSIIMFVCVGVVCLFAKEKPLIATEPSNGCNNVKKAFASIYHGIKTLPRQLMVFTFVFFCVVYGFTAYNGNKGQFFGLVVFDGDATLADSCGSNCTVAQNNYNKGVQMAGGKTDLIGAAFGYVFSWTIPYLVSLLGSKNTLVFGLLPQVLFVIMAYCSIPEVNVTLVVLSAITQNVYYGLIVPIIIHVVGEEERDAKLGMYVGALNSANCAGQFLNFVIGSGLVTTSMGYRLPILVGGLVSFLGMIVCALFLKINFRKM